MKKEFAILALALAGAACQQQAPPTTTATSSAIPPAPALVVPTAGLPVLFTAADTLTRPMRQVLHQYDLSKLWQGDTKERREHPTLEGFFGPDHYRFVLVITKAQRDAQHPECYYVQGKCHYRQNIRPFIGLLTVRQLIAADAFYSPSDDVMLPAYAGSPEPDSFAVRYERAGRLIDIYTARARLQLVEGHAPNSGIFEGEAELNFYVKPPQRIGYANAPTITDGEPARGSGLLLRGRRRNVTTQQVKQFVVADDVFAAAPDVYKDFGIGERGFEINPKYARLGWNEAWANDEWWADSPKPRLNL
jgi:hypothetical protein